MDNYQKLEFLSRIKFLNLAFLIGFMAFFSHGTMHLMGLFGKNSLFAVIFSFSGDFIILLSFFYLRNKENTDICADIVLVLHLLFSLYLIYDGGIFLTGILWIGTFPVLLYYLKGIRRGNIWAGSTVLLILFMVLLGELGILVFPYPSFYLIASLVIFVTISVLIIFYEDTKSKSLELATYQLSHDLYTGLPNQARLIHDIQAMEDGALLRLDINNLTDISSVFGFQFGLDVLNALIPELQKIVGDSGKVYMITTDELGVLFYHGEQKKIKTILEKILSHRTYRETIHTKFNVDLQVIGGISYISSCSREDLLSSAELALKMARDEKSPIFHCKNPAILRSRFQDNINWSVLLRNALENDKIFPVFQPILNNKTGKIEKFECLVRMQSHDNKIIEPENFLAVSKKTDMYYSLTRKMIEKSFKKFENLPYFFSINLSIKDIENRDLNQFIIRKLKDYSRPEAVIFEITEGESIHNYDEINRFIRVVKRYGSKVAIDDFGSGYSNFNHIIQMDIDFLKLDASLIKPLGSDKNSEIMVQSIIHFAQKINVRTIAEYVSNDKIHSIVSGLGVDYSQGYFIGKPARIIREVKSA